MVKNIEAEQAVLGSILLDGDLIKELSLQPEHFAEQTHRVIFKAMKHVEASGKVIDLVSVATVLDDAISQIGGTGFLMKLSESVPSTANILGYQTLVFEAYKVRESQRITSEFSQNPDFEKVAELQQQFNSLQELGVSNTRTKNDILYEIFNDMHEMKGDMTGIDTGFNEINGMTGGLQNGDLIIVAARPSMGKSAFALNLCMKNCKDGGVSDFFSLEMPDKQLVHRMLSGMVNIQGSKWRNPQKLFSEKDHERAMYAIGEYEKWAINIHDNAKTTIADIRSGIRKTKKEYPGRKHLVVIDYLQLITVLGKYDRHDLAIGSITRELKQIARTFDVPIVLLSQLSRAVEQRQDKRPMMSDLRDSGSIEQDADMIAFLYREDYYNKETDAKDIVEIIIAKHRNGPTGTVNLAFIKEYGKFANIERRWSEENAG